MCSESLPKEFEKTTEVLPFTKYGLSSVQEFKEEEKVLQTESFLKGAGLNTDEIKLYRENEAGLIGQLKIESSVLKKKLADVYSKIQIYQENEHAKGNDEQASTSNEPDNIVDRLQKKSIRFYPEGHPMNNLKNLEKELFGHLQYDIIPIAKRRKMLRRLERKKERILSQQNQIGIGSSPIENTINRPNSLWDVKEIPIKRQDPDVSKEKIIGPKKPTMYTIKDKKIVRLEPLHHEGEDVDAQDQGANDEYRAVDIVVPVNSAEAELLEGTKMCIDDIKKIDRFKDYKPGIPSKVLYLKNIAPSVTEDQLLLLFNQFVLVNAGPVDLRLMTGRMRGQAFVGFQNEEVAIQALEEVNGTIMGGRPIIAQFGRNTNSIQDDNR